jgi:hypothetical protein
MVRVTLNGALEMLSCEISPEAMAAGDAALLQDLVRGAYNDAAAKVKESVQAELSSGMGGMPFPSGDARGPVVKALDELVGLLTRLPGHRAQERPQGRLLSAQDRLVLFGFPFRQDPRAQGLHHLLLDLRLVYGGRSLSRMLVATRERGLICAVEQPQDVVTIEASREFHGLYHVLGGLISPLDGVGPEDLRIRELVARSGTGEVTEVVVATNPTVEGDTTALYLKRLLEPTGVAVTRLATGIPVGGDLEYADRLTLARSFRGRTTL